MATEAGRDLLGIDPETGGKGFPLRSFAVKVFTWTPSTSTNVTAQEVFRSAGGTFDPATATLFRVVASTVTLLEVTFQYAGPGSTTPGTRFSYAVRARSGDLGGGSLRSPFSAPVILRVGACL